MMKAATTGMAVKMGIASAIASRARFHSLRWRLDAEPAVIETKGTKMLTHDPNILSSPSDTFRPFVEIRSASCRPRP